MASPGELKGQRKGSCGHIMAVFDQHEKCARCCEKKLGQDLCVLGNKCLICEGFTDLQREKLATPSYKIRKERKAGLLVSPKEVTVLGSLNADDQSGFESFAQVSAIKIKLFRILSLTAASHPVQSIPGPGDVYDDGMQEPLFQSTQGSTSATVPSPKQTGSEETFTRPGRKLASSSLFTQGPTHTGQEPTSTSQGTSPTGKENTCTGQFEKIPYPPTTSSAFGTGPAYGLTDRNFRELPLQDISDEELSGDEDSTVEKGKFCF